MTDEHENSPEGKLSEAINAALKARSSSANGAFVYSINGIMKPTALLKQVGKSTDNQYKRVLVQAGQEFMFDATRVGARGKLIFEFLPVDAQPYQRIEFMEKDIFSAFPSVQADLAALTTIAAGSPEPSAGISWELAKSVFFKHLKNLAAQEKDQAVQRVKEAAIGNPLWGMF